jgi:hypothetical protein
MRKWYLQNLGGGDNSYDYEGIDGETYTVDWEGSEGFKTDNAGKAGTKDDLNAAIKWFVEHGVMPNANDINVSAGAFANIKTDMATWMDAVGIDEDYFTPYVKAGYTLEYGAPTAQTADGEWVYQTEDGSYVNKSGAIVTDFGGATDTTGQPVVLDEESQKLVNPEGEVVVPPKAPGEGAPVKEPMETAYDKYYEDLFSQREGTLGKRMLDNNTSLYEKEAANAQVLANTGVQAQAMSQAQGIKQITDQVRNERLAQLRGGMSESQLADRELSMLMGSVNQFTNQGQMASQEAMAAQLAKSTARETAFNDYITQSTALGQNAAANYASLSGNIMDQAVAYQARMRAEGKTVSIDDAIAHMSNPNAE